MISALAKDASIDSLLIAAYRLGPYSSWSQAKRSFYGRLGPLSNVFAIYANKLAKSVFLDRVTSDELVLNHSASPIFTSLLFPHMASGWIHSCKSGVGISYLNKKGWGPKLRRGCAECVHEDQAAWGTGHWRVQHQLPGARICATHRERLWLRCKCGQPLGDVNYPTLPGEPCRWCGRTTYLREQSSVSAGQEALTHLYMQLLRGEGPPMGPKSREVAIFARRHGNFSDDSCARNFLKFFACRDIEELEVVLCTRIRQQILTDALNASTLRIPPALLLAIVAFLQVEACDKNNCSEI